MFCSSEFKGSFDVPFEHADDYFDKALNNGIKTLDSDGSYLHDMWMKSFDYYEMMAPILAKGLDVLHPDGTPVEYPLLNREFLGFDKSDLAKGELELLLADEQYFLNSDENFDIESVLRNRKVFAFDEVDVTRCDVIANTDAFIKLYQSDICKPTDAFPASGGNYFVSYRGMDRDVLLKTFEQMTGDAGEGVFIARLPHSGVQEFCGYTEGGSFAVFSDESYFHTALIRGIHMLEDNISYQDMIKEAYMDATFFESDEIKTEVVEEFTRSVDEFSIKLCDHEMYDTYWLWTGDNDEIYGSLIGGDGGDGGLRIDEVPGFMTSVYEVLNTHTHELSADKFEVDRDVSRKHFKSMVLPDCKFHTPAKGDITGLWQDAKDSVAQRHNLLQSTTFTDGLDSESVREKVAVDKMNSDYSNDVDYGRDIE